MPEKIWKIKTTPLGMKLIYCSFHLARDEEGCGCESMLRFFCKKHIEKIHLNKLKENPNFNTYVQLRNQFQIGPYEMLKGKGKYGKRINNKEYITKFIGDGETGAVFDDYFLLNLMDYEHFKYVDKYLEIIPQYIVKTTTFNNTKFLYWDVWNLIPHPECSYGEFVHNGCFYLAMIFLGFEFKIVKDTVKFKCRII